MIEDSFERSDVPDFTQLLMHRISSRGKETTSEPKTNFDPYKMMVNKKKSENGEPVDVSDVIKWPEKDLKALNDFCKKYNILGFNCGKMSPIAALSMLKSQLGIVDAPLEERIPLGYEKRGTPTAKYNSSFPYEQSINSKKTLLKG